MTSSSFWGTSFFPLSTPPAQLAISSSLPFLDPRNQSHLFWCLGHLDPSSLGVPLLHLLLSQCPPSTTPLHHALLKLLTYRNCSKTTKWQCVPNLPTQRVLNFYLSSLPSEHIRFGWWNCTRTNELTEFLDQFWLQFSLQLLMSWLIDWLSHH